jgi:carbon-monoxide dehydrogenase small subunit
MAQTIQFTFNGDPVSVKVNGDESLLSVIRSGLNYTGTKLGCNMGHCGACTVLIDREPVRSCMLLIEDVSRKNVESIEGLAKNGDLHPVQKAFVEHDALQCGFCTPGMIMNAVGLLYKNPNPTREEIIEGMEDNLCRCGSHNRIIQAIQTAAKEMNGGK